MYRRAWNFKYEKKPNCCLLNEISPYPSNAWTGTLSHTYLWLYFLSKRSHTYTYTHTCTNTVSQTHYMHCSVQAVPLTFPPLLTTSVLEYPTELSKGSLHYWTPWILNETLKLSSWLHLPLVIQPFLLHILCLQLSINHKVTCIITMQELHSIYRSL